MDLDLSPLWLSLKTALTATIITFLVGIAAAGWMVGYHGKAKGLIDGIFTLPLVLPPTVVGFLLLLLFGKNGPIGQLLSTVGLTVIFSWAATVIAATVVAFPLMYRTTLAGFEQVNPHLIQAAQTLGASRQTIFWQVMLPLSLPGIMAGTILAFARALGEFGATLMLAGNIPGRTQTIPTAIFFAAEAGKMTQALAWVMIIVAIALAVITALNYWSTSQQLWDVEKRSRINWHLSLTILRLFSRVAIIPKMLQPVSQIETRWGERRASLLLSKLGQGSHLSANLHKQLANFTLNVEFTAGENPLGLLGASGSGKTMLLRCIAGLATPQQGHIELNGRVLFDSATGTNLPTDQRRIGFLFQDYALFPHMTVAQNIAFGLQNLSQRLSLEECDRRVKAQLTSMRLQGLENRYPHQISGGQQQRVALARALAVEPEALLLDEPFSALDTHLRSQVERQLLETLATYSGVTLFVTHNLEEAYRLCQNLLVLAEGRAIATSSKQDIFERPATFTVAQLTGCKNFSRAQAISSHRVKALDWGCTLQMIEPVPTAIAYVGIRAHHLIFAEEARGNGQAVIEKGVTGKGVTGKKPEKMSDLKNSPYLENTFPCWLAQTSETPHRMTLYLKLHTPPAHLQDYHLQAEVFKEKWDDLKGYPLPWHICLEPLRLFSMQS